MRKVLVRVVAVLLVSFCLAATAALASTEDEGHHATAPTSTRSTSSPTETCAANQDASSCYSSESEEEEEDEETNHRRHAHTTTPNKKKRERVAVIGCGPSGMFFLHAMAKKKALLLEAGDMEGLEELPEIVVYEKASAPGGVWRPLTNSSHPGSVDMFGGLWTNSPSFLLEFYDYTFQDHFKNQGIPLYLPRKILLEYMLARVTQVDPNIFQNHVQFNTQVEWVRYNEKAKKFMIEIYDQRTEEWTEEAFDKCIWAGGIEGKPLYPDNIISVLEEGGFLGATIHSSKIVDVDSSMKGKRILLVGDSASAEDLTLQALKAGADRIIITSVAQSEYASETSSWPGGRVDNYKCLVNAVLENGTDLLCTEVDPRTRVALPDGFSVELKNIDLVIYCTGYALDFDYMKPNLQYRCKRPTFKPPQGWKPLPNSLTPLLGDVELHDKIKSFRVCDNIYRHLLISNPNMMLMNPHTDIGMIEVDAIAASLASYVLGQVELPSESVMIRSNHLEKLEELNVASFRKHNDPKYRQAINKISLAEKLRISRNATYFEYYMEILRFDLRKIARDEATGGLGGGLLGSDEELSEMSEFLLSQMKQIEPVRRFPVRPHETDWRTFRDSDPSPYSSIYTREPFAPLPAHWMDLDDNGNPLPSVPV